MLNSGLRCCFVVVLSCFFSIFIFAQEKMHTGKLESAWTEIGRNGNVFVRAIFSNTQECPSITFGVANEKKTEQMEKRPVYFQTSFPVLVCQKDIPKEASSIQLEDRFLPILKKDVQRVLLLGDSGCRIKKKMIQNCNDIKKWPLETIAKLIQEKKPDVIIHMGDYHYRETPCPEGKKKCHGAISGDNWQSWNQDFFTPAQAIFSTAPILYVRGDHEACGRGGVGWFNLLEPGNNEEVCQKYTEPYKVTLGSKTLLVFDSSQVSDDNVNQKNLEVYKKQLANLNLMKASSENWFLTQKPVWGIGLPRKKHLNNYEDDFKTQELQALFEKNPIDKSFDLLLAGHIHMFQLLSVGKEYPPQIVSGNGGTLIEYYPPYYNAMTKVDHKKLQFFKFMNKFGITILNLEKGDRVSAQIFKSNGDLKDSCLIENREIKCKME